MFGAHMTPENIFRKYIFPEIKNVLEKYVWTIEEAEKEMKKADERERSKW